MAEINKTKINIEELRISKLRDYLFKIIDELLTNKTYQINANMLSKDIPTHFHLMNLFTVLPKD